MLTQRGVLRRKFPAKKSSIGVLSPAKLSFTFSANLAEKEVARAENSCYYVRKPCGE
jgi:hypothetical protein